jgi:hypothetical protein
VLSTLEPNPVTAGATATLHVSDEGLPPGTLVGVAVSWECWDGDQWVETYVLMRGHEPFDAEVIEMGPGTTVAIPALGILLPATETVLIPHVSPGTYRLTEQAVQPGPVYFDSYVIVEVVAE